jgi:soluble lytic murein transglycosylase-like protein
MRNRAFSKNGLRSSAKIGVFAVVLALGVFACSRPGEGGQTPASAAPPPTRVEIFAAIEVRAIRYRMEPAFIYALVAAESNFDPRARNGDACGLMQLKRGAWVTVSSQPYEPAVWDWRANLDAGIDYLAYSRAYLHRKNVFSYPLLLAAFHYGLDYVEERRFDLPRVPVPDNAIYRQLWAGNLSPVPPPPK